MIMEELKTGEIGQEMTPLIKDSRSFLQLENFCDLFEKTNRKFTYR